uniref:F-box domain-containing protein n=1 Tax=Chenopodium quinoa TaxID=63459 RepID=A0A803M1M0_CHEQI
MITEILSILPVKSLLRFRCVSKSWRELIDSKDFVNIHFSKSNSNGTVILLSRGSLHSFDFHHPERPATQLWFPVNTNKKEEDDFEDGYNLVGSCNGLVCFEGLCYYVVYNPATRTFKQLPKQKKRCKFRGYQLVRRRNMFGYDSIGDDYKVISFIEYEYTRDNIDKRKVKTQLYSMKANSWEIIQKPPWKFNLCHSRCVIVDNSLHWTGEKMMRSFDLNTRKYEEMRLPEEIGQEASRLAVLRGHLHVVTDSLDVWTLNKDGIEKSWSWLFRYSLVCPENTPSSFDVMLCPMPICGMKEIQGCTTKKEVDKINCYDLESQAIREVKIEGLPCEPLGFYAESWAESLVPLVD